MSDYIYELLLEALSLFDFNTIPEVVIFLIRSNIAKFFDHKLGPLLHEDNALELPDLPELQRILHTTVNYGIDSEEFRNAMNSIVATDHERHLAAVAVWAFIMAVSCDAEADITAAQFRSYIILKLMDAVWKYVADNGANAGWGLWYLEAHAAIDREESSETEDSEDYETDDDRETGDGDKTDEGDETYE